MGCGVSLALPLFAVVLVIQGSWIPGPKVNVLDLSPNYAGTLTGITNGIGSISGVIEPYLIKV